ncbi:hypothetical protein ACO22_06155 [Paracoccidioides brasiliensis]|uniref:Uncharacterized protein n=1 Tax=Paracoccidioides brasiliensis TaxID=121759 RepID=A0A1D2J8J2_PARBR|nr:hypothetical protein ACO22_06155 [Paracoccidioides brasiliensis]
MVDPLASTGLRQNRNFQRYWRLYGALILAVRGAPHEQKTAKEDWLKTWKELPQTKIQTWIEWIVHHIQEIIHLKGGNEYKKGNSKLTIEKINSLLSIFQSSRI